jgi:hypothetical protein
MVLCGNHQAADVTVPFEHAQFLTKLRAFQYKESNTNREMQIAETAAQMSQILSAVPGLIAELADLPVNDIVTDHDGGEPKPALTHLRLILSANELALLPFELANAGSAFPGAGQSLALQPHVPICITREVRRINSPYLLWPSKPKILLAASSAGGAIPLDAHLLALRRALDPWLHHFEEGEQGKLDDHLTVLPAATVPALMEAVATGGYTHIHLLAHGHEEKHEHEYGVRYGIALHDSANPRKMDFVEGTRLAALLRPSLRGRTEKLALPTVVTLATCDSGAIGSVVGAGASIAHALHEAGIPLIVASQFPLSFGGSVVMTEVLYEGLLEGSDPRSLLVKLRRELVARVPDQHDWASVVAYAAFPQDLERQLRRNRIERAQERIRAALNRYDAIRAQLVQAKSDAEASGGSDPQRVADLSKRLSESLPRIEAAIRSMEALLGDDGSERAVVHGLLASAYKRLAELLWGELFGTSTGEASPEVAPGTERPAIELLRKSRDHYRRSYESGRSEPWALMQHISLTAVLEGPGAVDHDGVQIVRLMSQKDVRTSDNLRRAWGLGNLIELAILSPVLAVQGAVTAVSTEEITFLVADLIDSVGADSFEVYSTRSQVARYIRFFPQAAIRMAAFSKRGSARDEGAADKWNAVTEAAKTAMERFPDVTRY